MLLATMIPDSRGIVDIYRQGTYGGGIIPRHPHRGSLALPEVLNEPAARIDRPTYERAIILATGGFAD